MENKLHLYPIKDEFFYVFIFVYVFKNKFILKEQLLAWFKIITIIKLAKGMGIFLQELI